MTDLLALFDLNDEIENRSFAEMALNQDFKAVRSVLSGLKKKERFAMLLKAGFTYRGNDTVKECVELVYEQVTNGRYLKNSCSVEHGCIVIRGMIFGPKKKDVVESLFTPGKTLSGHYTLSESVCTILNGAGDALLKFEKKSGTWVLSFKAEVFSRLWEQDYESISFAVQAAFNEIVDTIPTSK
ncbi:MAG: hypothetical protein IBX56_14755 [Methylomicrobium sp.]|nr:hypothetical protein [Methylomicrobium sp.]